jgi:hypothetical protein
MQGAFRQQVAEHLREVRSNSRDLTRRNVREHLVGNQRKLFQGRIVGVTYQRLRGLFEAHDLLAHGACFRALEAAAFLPSLVTRRMSRLRPAVGDKPHT